MLKLRSLLTRRASGPVTSIFGASYGDSRDALAECEALIWTQLARAGIPGECVAVEAAVSNTSAKRSVIEGRLHVSGWQSAPVLRLMIGLPLVEAKVRKAFETSWLKDVSGFGGLWLRGFGELQSQEAAHHLRQAIARLEESQSARATVPDRIWSMPDELR